MGIRSDPSRRRSHLHQVMTTHLQQRWLSPECGRAGETPMAVDALLAQGQLAGNFRLIPIGRSFWSQTQQTPPRPASPPPGSAGSSSCSACSSWPRRSATGAAGPPPAPSRSCPPGWPAWTGSPGPALGVGALSAAVSPKNAALTISAAASVAAVGLPGGQQAITLAVFVLLGSMGILAPLVIYLTTGERAIKILDGWKTWASDHNEAIMAVLLLVFGVKLIGDGIGMLS